MRFALNLRKDSVVRQVQALALLGVTLTWHQWVGAK